MCIVALGASSPRVPSAWSQAEVASRNCRRMRSRCLSPNRIVEVDTQSGWTSSTLPEGIRVSRLEIQGEVIRCQRQTLVKSLSSDFNRKRHRFIDPRGTRDHLNEGLGVTNAEFADRWKHLGPKRNESEIPGISLDYQPQRRARRSRSLIPNGAVPTLSQDRQQLVRIRLQLRLGRDRNSRVPAGPCRLAHTRRA